MAGVMIGIDPEQAEMWPRPVLSGEPTGAQPGSRWSPARASPETFREEGARHIRGRRPDPARTGDGRPRRSSRS